VHPYYLFSNKVINFYRKSVPETNFNYQNIKDFTRINYKQVNLFNCWEEEVAITPGQLTETGGLYAVKSLIAAAEALKDKKIQGFGNRAKFIKKNTQSAEFNFTGHIRLI
jgi:4-hydroxythreonine-4-phosphate dehydrogenase